jgi:hypothetical protein
MPNGTYISGSLLGEWGSYSFGGASMDDLKKQAKDNLLEVVSSPYVRIRSTLHNTTCLYVQHI